MISSWESSRGTNVFGCGVEISARTTFFALARLSVSLAYGRSGVLALKGGRLIPLNWHLATCHTQGILRIEVSADCDDP